MNSNIFSKYPLNNRWKMNLPGQTAKKPLRLNKDTLNQFRAEQRKLSLGAAEQEAAGWEGAEQEGAGWEAADQEAADWKSSDREGAGSEAVDWKSSDRKAAKRAEGQTEVCRPGGGAFNAAENGRRRRQEAGQRQGGGRVYSAAGYRGGPDSSASLRNLILWSEILGEPVCRKRKRNHGSQSNSGRR